MMARGTELPLYQNDAVNGCAELSHTGDDCQGNLDLPIGLQSDQDADGTVCSACRLFTVGTVSSLSRPDMLLILRQ